jgi:hypothetical protein
MNTITKKAVTAAGQVSLLLLLTIASPVHADEVPVSLSIDPVATLDRSRVGMTVTGTYNCGPFVAVTFAAAQLSVQVAQAAGREIASGFAVNSIDPNTCDGSNKPFSVNVPSGNIPWHKGTARVSGTLSVNVDGTPSEATTVVTVSVR